MKMEDAVRQATSTVAGADVAAVELAVTYAVHIDDGGDLEKTGPLLLAVLESLLLTPKARTAIVRGGGQDGGAGNPLDELRKRRAAREHNPPTVDPTAEGTDA